MQQGDFLKEDDDDGRLNVTSDASMRRREATQPREAERGSDRANAVKTKRGRAAAMLPPPGGA